MIEQVSDLISSYCHLIAADNSPRTFARETLEEDIVVMRRVKAIWLSRSPATVAAITINGVEQDLDDFIIQPQTGAIRCKSQRVIFEEDDEILVEYAAGYVTPDQVDEEADPPVVRTLPADLEAACILAVQQAWSFAARETFDVESTTETLEDMGSVTDRFLSLTRAQALPKQAADALDLSYKRL